MSTTFRGGLTVTEKKNTHAVQIERMAPPARLFVPLAVVYCGEAHVASPTVSVGDEVKKGQVIAESDVLPVHSPVSGKIVGMTDVSLPGGVLSPAMEIENDMQDTPVDGLMPFSKRLGEAVPDELISLIRAAGIVGMSGEGKPTWLKLQSAAGKAERLIVNCIESESYITCDYRLLVEEPASVINGAKIIMKALGLRHADIAVTDDRMSAVKRLEKMVSQSDLFDVVVLKRKYPQGDKRLLVSVLTKEEIPIGGDAEDVGCAVFNASTCAAIFNSFRTGMPLVDRVVTVDGDCIRTPKNLRIAVGTPFAEVIDYCGGFKKAPARLISGGAMMGHALKNADSPVTKTTTGILALSGRTVKTYEQAPVCIRCGRCLGVCPMRLVPYELSAYAAAGMTDECRELHIDACTECGGCAYICPGAVPIVANIKKAKKLIKAEDAKEATADDKR